MLIIFRNKYIFDAIITTDVVDKFWNADITGRKFTTADEIIP